MMTLRPDRPLRLLFAVRPEVLTRVLNVVARAVSRAVLKRVGLSRSAGAVHRLRSRSP